MGCNKIINTCGGVKYSLKCVDTEGITPPEVSDLHGQGCLSGYQVVEDIYKILGGVAEALENSDLNYDCVDVDTNSEGKITQKEINAGILDYICKLPTKQDVNQAHEVSPSNIDLSECSLDYGGLLDACGDNIDDLCVLLQVLIDSANALTTLQATVNTQQTEIDDLDTRVTALEALHP